MKLERVTQLAVFYAPTTGDKRRVGRLALRGREILFEYDAAFLASGLPLSPVRLPLAPGVTAGDPTRLDGLMGLFDDSLPDGWGRLLIDRRAAQLGVNAATLTPLDRLALVGHHGMGALVYEPETRVDGVDRLKLSELARQAAQVLGETGRPDLEALIRAGGSPQGARPKALIEIDGKGTLHADTGWTAPGRTAWLVKFNARNDPPYAASLEDAYFRMARSAGIDVPRTQVLDRKRTRDGFFAIERFDRRGAARVHAHTLGGLLELPRGYPALDYQDVLKVTRQLTRDESAVRELYRRACFNVLAHNRDDHCRNFAFLMAGDGTWRPSPAYDLTCSEGPGGEHTTLVMGEGRAPGLEHLKALAKAVDLRHAGDDLEAVRRAVKQFRKFAEAAGVPRALRLKTEQQLVL